MSKALARRTIDDRDRVHATARATCKMADAYRSGIVPAVLEEAQAHLRSQLLHVESEVRDWFARTPARRGKLKALRRRYGVVPSIGEHLRLCQLRRETLAQERSILRQAGDTLAWMVLRADPRLIAPLFARRTHHLSKGVGLYGVTLVQERAHASNRFLVLDNDLTRCLGQGDITVVRANGSWEIPLALECQSTEPNEEIREGTSITVNMFGAVGSREDHSALHAEFVAVLGLQDGSTRTRASERKKGQEGELVKSSQALVRIASTFAAPLFSSRSHWKAVDALVHRALTLGSGYDIPEKGLAFAAIRTENADAESMLEYVFGILHSQGFTADDPSVSSFEFSRTDSWSALAPPIGLWPVSRSTRIALLTGDVFLSCIMTGSLWNDAFSAQGLDLSESGGRWLIRGDRGARSFSRLEVRKLLIGVAFAGVSPAAIAEAMRDEISLGSDA